MLDHGNVCRRSLDAQCVGQDGMRMSVVNAQNILAHFLFIEGDGRDGRRGQAALPDTFESGVKLSSASLAFKFENASRQIGSIVFRLC